MHVDYVDAAAVSRRNRENPAILDFCMCSVHMDNRTLNIAVILLRTPTTKHEVIHGC